MEYSIKPKILGERRIIHYPQKRIIGLYVCDMCLTEFDEKKYEDVLREEGREEGLAEGLEKGLAKGRKTEVFVSVQEGDYGVARGAQKLNLSVEEFEKEMFAVGYQILVEI